MVCVFGVLTAQDMDNLAQEFLRQFSFNTVVDVLRRELKALRQRSKESISSFISHWHRKIAEIIDRPLERDKIHMVLRSLQPRITRHVVGVPFIDFGSVVLALYDVEDGISRDLWTNSSPSDVKRKKPSRGQRSIDVNTINSTNQRLPRRHQLILQLPKTHSSYPPQQYRSRAPHQTYDHTYMQLTLSLPYYAAQGAPRDHLFHIRPQDNHVMWHSLPQDLQYSIPGLELNRPLLLLV